VTRGRDRVERERPAAVLHLGAAGNYVQGLFAFLEARGEMAGHAFLARGPVDPTFEDGPEPPRWLERAGGRLAFIVAAWRRGASVDKIVVHGLFDPNVMVVLALSPALRRKTCWIVWGADLYLPTRRSPSLRDRVVEALRHFVAARIPQIATHVPGDGEECRRRFGWRGEYVEAITYPNSIVRTVPTVARGEGAPLRVLAGNSASATNHHRDLFERLERVDDGSMEVVCPLAYGPDDVRSAALEAGRAAFGARFHPLLEMVPLPRYLDLLATIDVAVFNHDRQAALGNVLALLGMGARVFLKRATTTWQHLEALGVTVFDVDALDLAVPFPERERTMRIIARAYSERRLLEGLRAVFGPIGESERRAERPC
jgi:dTDP-N-acetylfucosamine:lipid II N-acetylfucosaminyltransferase